ncbi:MAG: site-specific integrase [Mollicutes bacterium]|nr:site-specific integrase [Mollicutes bacterium]
MQYWTLNEFNDFIKHVDDITYKTIFWLLFYTGMRKGELLALTIDDIDLENKTININKTCSYVTGKGYIVTTPKTLESKRIIYINDKTIDVIKEYLKYISNQYEFKKDTPLFSINGALIPKETLRRNFKYYQRLAGVKDIRLHDLRHSHVALLINLGQDPLTIKKRLGHSDITITLNTYGHLYDDAQKKLANKLDEI